MALTWLADVLRAAGLTVVEHTNWRTHDRPGNWSPTYGVIHATAAPRSQADSTQIGVVRNGRSDLPGPIANAVIDRKGVWHVVSGGRCNSTLTGTAGPYEGRGNTNALSTEACNDNRGEPWTDVQYRAYVRGWAAWCRRLGWSASRLVGHKEHTPGHKTDPTFNMAQFRRDVAAALAGEDDDVSQKDVTDGLRAEQPYQSASVADWAEANGLGPTSQRGLAEYTWSDVRKLAGQVSQLQAVLTQLAGRDLVDEPAIVAGVLAGLTPEAIADAIPPGIAEDVVDALARRIGAVESRAGE